MNPSTSRASKLLSDNANEINRKKVRINAQVTAIISVLEIVFMMTSVMIVGLLTRANTAGTIIIGLSVYFILLPRAFLMNTSHNKNRIVEYGWKNVFMNFLGIANKQAKVTPENESKATSNKFEGISRSKHLKVKNVESMEMSAMTALGIKDAHVDLEGPGPSNITKHKQNVLPSTSTGNDASSNTKQLNENKDEQEIITLEVNQSMIEDAKLKLVNKQIYHMKNSLDDEDKYIFYFRQLIAVQEDTKNGRNPNNIILESYFSNKKQCNATIRKKLSRKQSKAIENLIIVPKQEIVIVFNNVDETFSKTVLDDDFRKRIKERVKILSKFNNFSNIIDENNRDNFWKQFDSFLEEMIDMEESFIG